ncbi:dihydroxy-acid dehydratase [Escherichia coli]
MKGQKGAGHAGDALSHHLSQVHGIGQAVRLITHGRFSGGTSGLSIGHVSPEAAGGTIGSVEDGDIININIPARSMVLEVADSVLAARRVAVEARGLETAGSSASGLLCPARLRHARHQR